MRFQDSLETRLFGQKGTIISELSVPEVPFPEPPGLPLQNGGEKREQYENPNQTYGA